MKDYINIGPTPCEEPCAQVGTPDYAEKALAECKRFIQLLRKTFGPEPEGARLAVKWFDHDFGSYCEVVCHYDTEIKESADYALRCEGEMPATWEEEPQSGTPPELLYLWHPGTTDLFSGYGLALAPAHLVGLIMIDRPRPCDPAWLAEIRSTFGDYQLTAMTQGGERGLVCKIHIAQESLRYLKSFDHPLASALHKALMPLVRSLPAVTLALQWDGTSGCWVSTIVKGGSHV